MTKPVWAGKLCVLLYESDDSMVKTYHDAFVEVFRAAGYEADIHALTKNHKEFADPDITSKRYFDVVISDVSFGQTVGNTVGLETLTEIKKHHPGLFTIAYTLQEITYNQCVESFRFDLFVGKLALKRPEYVKTVAQQVRERLRINTYAYLADGSEVAWPGITQAEYIDLTRVVRKITFSGEGDSHSPRIESIALSPEEGGYSDARVFQMTTTTEHRFTCVQAVLKIATAKLPRAIAALRQESLNYRRYVRWYLPYYWRPELIAEADEGSMSGICYALVSAWNVIPRTLTHWLQYSRLDAVDAAIDSIFHPKFQRWYDARNVQLEDHIDHWYFNHYFENASFESHQRTLSRFIELLTAEDRSWLEQEELLERNVGPALLGRSPGRRFRSCIVHGDLNTSNVFLGAMSKEEGQFTEVSFIDFASTGRGPVFHDFVVFEINVRLYFAAPEIETLRQTIEAERALLRGDGGSMPYGPQLLKLRQYAEQNFEGEPIGNYVFGIAAFSLSLLMAPNLTDHQRRRLAGCILANVAELKTIGYWDVPRNQRMRTRGRNERQRPRR